MFKTYHSTQFSHHTNWLVYTICIVVLALALGVIFGEPKIMSEISPLDTLGEGSIVLLTLGWILAVLASRPPSRVTSMLVLGLGCFLFSVTLDVLDEFYRYPSSVGWLSHIESYPAVVGMIVMTFALYLWQQEQRALTQQLRRREWDYRSHQDIDPVTQLYRGDYWQSRICTLQRSGQDAFIALIDINNFSDVNRAFGLREGDRYLFDVAQLIVMSLRESDLACRYAGDRFAVMLPEVTDIESEAYLERLKSSIRHVGFTNTQNNTTVHLDVRACGIRLTPSDNVEHNLKLLMQQLDTAKRCAA